MGSLLSSRRGSVSARGHGFGIGALMFFPLFLVPITIIATLAAIVGFVSTYELSSRKESVITTAIAVISTFIAASCYGVLVTVFANDPSISAGRGLPLSVFLVPLCVLAIR